MMKTIIYWGSNWVLLLFWESIIEESQDQTSREAACASEPGCSSGLFGLKKDRAIAITITDSNRSNY